VEGWASAPQSLLAFRPSLGNGMKGGVLPHSMHDCLTPAQLCADRFCMAVPQAVCQTLASAVAGVGVGISACRIEQAGMPATARAAQLLWLVSCMAWLGPMLNQLRHRPTYGWMHMPTPPSMLWPSALSFVGNPSVTPHTLRSQRS
jgi:hypothetical protein